MKKHYIKKLFATVAILLCSITANAHDFEVDGIFYQILSRTDNTVAVTYKGYFHDSYFNEYNYAVAIPASVTYNGTTYSVTTIGYSAFSSCTNLTNVTIPNSVTTIERSAFAGCTSLANVTIPKSVTYIRSSAFYGCSNLANITIPNNVTDIGDEAFYGCTNLANVTIGNSVTYIGFYAFSNCKNLKSVTIGNSVTTIGNNAFYYCTNLTNVTIPNSVTYIGEWAFFNCKTLASVTIPNSVTTIGNYAFENCNSLKEVHITDIAAWCNIDFGYSYSNPLSYAKNLYLNGELVTDLIIPEGMTEIKKCAFIGCTSLTSTTIPNSVTSIEDRTFNSCSNLKSIHLLGETPPSVGNYNFIESQYTNITLYVPIGLLETYQNADTWKNFIDIREEGATRIDDVNADNIAIEVTRNGIKLPCTEGETVVVYTTNGTRVANISSYTGGKIALDKGVYIVRVKNNTLKVKL